MTDKPKKRRMLRFSLRILILTWTVAALWFAMFVHRAKEQVRVVSRIGEVGHVIYEHEKVALPSVGSRIDYSAEPHGPGWLRDWLGDDYFRSVEDINFTPTNSLMQDVSSLLCVQAMSIVASELTDDALVDLGTAPKLRKLSIASGHGLTDDAFKHVGRIGGLQILWVSNTPVGDAGLLHLKECRGLRDLVLQKTHVTQAGVDRLAKLLPNASISFSDEYSGNSDIYRIEELRRRFKKDDELR